MAKHYTIKPNVVCNLDGYNTSTTLEINFFCDEVVKETGKTITFKFGKTSELTFNKDKVKVEEF